MSSKGLSKEFVVDVAVNLFREQGYQNVAMSDIAEVCNVRKASLYHHIESKDALLILSLKKEFNYFLSNIFNHILEDSNKSHKTKVENFIRDITSFLTKNRHGSLLSNVAREDISHIPEAKQIIKQHLNNWKRVIHSIIYPNKPSNAQTEMLAEDIWCTIQGTILLRSITNNTASLKRALAKLAEHAA